MSLFNRTLRPPPTASDEAIARYLAALRSEVRPDPLFQRRLRSDVVNRFVAAREGIGSSGRTGIGRGRMGQLGRACLYASCTFALSAASVLAASQEALPGEFLYPLKQRIEQVRIDVVPNHLHAELAGYALGERIEEMGSPMPASGIWQPRWRRASRGVRTARRIGPDGRRRRRGANRAPHGRARGPDCEPSVQRGRGGPDSRRRDAAEEPGGHRPRAEPA